MPPLSSILKYRFSTRDIGVTLARMVCHAFSAEAHLLAKDFILTLLQADPANRPTAEVF